MKDKPHFESRSRTLHSPRSRPCATTASAKGALSTQGRAIGNGDRDRGEFLPDVGAFANASGGDLVLGMKTKDLRYGRHQEVHI